MPPGGVLYVFCINSRRTETKREPVWQKKNCSVFLILKEFYVLTNNFVLYGLSLLIFMMLVKHRVCILWSNKGYHLKLNIVHVCNVLLYYSTQLIFNFHQCNVLPLLGATVTFEYCRVINHNSSFVYGRLKGSKVHAFVIKRQWNLKNSTAIRNSTILFDHGLYSL